MFVVGILINHYFTDKIDHYILYSYNYHTSINAPRLCDYLNIKDCSPLCQQVELPMIENSHAAMLDLLGLQKVNHLLAVAINIMQLIAFFERPISAAFAI